MFARENLIFFQLSVFLKEKVIFFSISKDSKHNNWEKLIRNEHLDSILHILFHKLLNDLFFYFCLFKTQYYILHNRMESITYSPKRKLIQPLFEEHNFEDSKEHNTKLFLLHLFSKSNQYDVFLNI